MPLRHFRTYEFHPGTVSKSYRESEQSSTAYASTTNGASVSCGKTGMHMKSKSSITTEDEARDDRKLPPIHPGETLKADFLEPHGLSGNAVARQLGVPPNRINDILRGRRAISADTALRLERCFGVSALFWLNLQQNYELERARKAAGRALNRIKPVAA